MMDTTSATRPTSATLDRIERLNAEPEGDELLDVEVVYRSKGTNFAAVRIGRRRWMEQGEQQVTGRVAYEFAPSGEFRTRDRRIVDYLESLPTFNLEFWRVGAEPGRPPSTELVDEQIMAAVATLNDDVLSELEVQERNVHKREQVLARILTARRSVQGTLATAEVDEAA
jgi:hypothetical protein